MLSIKEKERAKNLHERAMNGETIYGEDCLLLDRFLYEERLSYLLGLLSQAVKAEDWKEVCILTELNHELMPFVFGHLYAKIPEELRRDFVVECYSSHGDSVPGCRRALRGLKKNGINELPKACRDKEYITVYRAGEEDPSKAKYRISWTLDKKVALFFMQDYMGSRYRTNYLYKAKIRPCDVIAYYNGRKEKEVLQYRKVFDIEVIGDKTKYPPKTNSSWGE